MREPTGGYVAGLLAAIEIIHGHMARAACPDTSIYAAAHGTTQFSHLQRYHGLLTILPRKSSKVLRLP